MNRLTLSWAGGLCALLFFFVSIAQSQPVRSRILEGIDARMVDEGIELTVHLSFPVRIVRHFPEAHGRQLQIAMQPVNISRIDRGLIKSRESLRIPDSLIEALQEVNFEGSLPGGPYLTLRFFQDQGYRIRIGSDFRSIRITLIESDLETEE